MAATPTTTRPTTTCGRTMSETVVGQASPDADRRAPRDRHRRHGIAAVISSFTLPAGSTRPAPSPSLSSAPRPAPRPPAPPGHHGRDGDRDGNATYNPTAGYTPTGAGDTGGTPPTAVTPITTLLPRPAVPCMTETVVGQASPTVTASGPATGAAGTAITAAHQLDPRRLLGLQRHRHDHLQGLRPRPAPRPPAPPGHHGGHGHGLRQRHLQPDGRLHAHRRQLLVVRLLRR